MLGLKAKMAKDAVKADIGLGLLKTKLLLDPILWAPNPNAIDGDEVRLEFCIKLISLTFYFFTARTT